jgi:hypothetical protein
VDLSEYGKEENTYCCFRSEADALEFICKDNNGNMPEEVDE